ncbi:ABC transporter ATP-binding protein [Arthrobacter sp. Leaf69]|uniref:ABC transporter ATP-binding protein n=1 Tax=Arthrobacter sp. Leaf69 TaxID=1736232 RepID=UPI0006F2EAF5|nr:ATP-binding cassette domain-containing protein [Arthrobacter sp. Leaf69]KQN95370.1 multidrug ABC transporter ATP-binding protein [Arthrobacter sp. Leaf69]
MIEAYGLTKTYGKRTAVDGVTFTVQPGQVTGFLGPNGAGKSTTMRLILGLDRPTSGRVLVNGRPYVEHAAPLREVGALLDAKALHPARSAVKHLSVLAATHGISRNRVDEVMAMTGITEIARKRIKGFSLGMGQRLGIAAALLGDPRTVIFDEPVNGLDPEGVQWVRNLSRHLASEGRAVFLSSHLMSEMAQTADHLIVIGRGRIIADAPVAEILAQGRDRSLVRSDQLDELRAGLAAGGIAFRELEPGLLEVSGAEPRKIAWIAREHDALIHELTPVRASLEEAYMELTRDEVEYRSAALAGAGEGTR